MPEETTAPIPTAEPTATNDGTAGAAGGEAAPSILGLQEEPKGILNLQDAKGAEQPAVEQPAADVLTIDDVSRPDDSPVTDAHLKEFVETLNNSKLSVKERAQALMDQRHRGITDMLQEAEARWVARQAKHQEEIRNHPDYGGDKLPDTVRQIRQFMVAYGDDELFEELARTGVEDHPAFFKFVAKLAAERTEGGLVTGNTGGAVDDSYEARMRQLFPSSGDVVGH